MRFVSSICFLNSLTENDGDIPLILRRFEVNADHLEKGRDP